MNDTIVKLLQDWGVNHDSMYWLYWCFVVLGITIVIYIVNLLCNRAIIPLVRKVREGTRSMWDDILLNDTMLQDIVRLFPPIIIAALLPLAFTDGHLVLEFLLKVNTIYMIVVVAKMLCSFLTSLYDLTNHNGKLKNHPLKGVYQMLKIA
ncbi:MAG: mechanosensitive ion channel family protein, partial [Bacteroidaceae bacterium]|nr:mechanosensitive ion channel family protein [Bacteroidaceae bacterium]